MELDERTDHAGAESALLVWGNVEGHDGVLMGYRERREKATRERDESGRNAKTGEDSEKRKSNRRVRRRSPLLYFCLGLSLCPYSDTHVSSSAGSVRLFCWFLVPPFLRVLPPLRLLLLHSALYHGRLRGSHCPQSAGKQSLCGTRMANRD